LELEFPIEFIVEGTPVSLQAARAESKNEWKDRVRNASLGAVQPGLWASQGRVAATLYYFPATPMQGDLDNIVKLVLDALAHHIYVDDSQVDRIVVQRFEPGNVFPFASPTATLEDALNRPKPLLYVRITDDPFEDLS